MIRCKDDFLNSHTPSVGGLIRLIESLCFDFYFYTRLRFTDRILGQMGRVAVIGGSEDYTGAPYFSAMASARLGCDMVCRHFPPLPLITYSLTTRRAMSSANLRPPKSSRPTPQTSWSTP